MVALTRYEEEEMSVATDRDAEEETIATITRRRKVTIIRLAARGGARKTTIGEENDQDDCQTWFGKVKNSHLSQHWQDDKEAGISTNFGYKSATPTRDARQESIATII